MANSQIARLVSQKPSVMWPKILLVTYCSSFQPISAKPMRLIGKFAKISANPSCRDALDGWKSRYTPSHISRWVKSSPAQVAAMNAKRLPAHDGQSVNELNVL